MIKKLLTLFLILSFPLTSFASSLLFTDGGPTRVPYGNTGTDPTVGTIYCWVYPTATTASRSIFRKISVGLAGGWSLATAASGGFRMTIDYAVTDADARTTSGMVVNTWTFVAGTFDGTNAPKIYSGTLTSPVKELAYNISTAPSGARVTDGGATVLIGNIESPPTTFAGGYPGRIAMCNFIDGTALSLIQLRSHQLFPRVDLKSKIFTFFGLTGLITQPDWSGKKNSGTNIGAVLNPGLPIPNPFG